MSEFKLREMTLNQAITAHPEVRSMILPVGSTMGEVIDHIDMGYGKYKRIRVIIGFDKGRPVGWCWLKRSYAINNPWDYLQSSVIIVWLFVRPNYRRLGLGTNLFNEADKFSKKQHRTLVSQPWDRVSDSFFDNFKVKTY